MMSTKSGASSHRHMHQHHLFYKKPPPPLTGEPDELDVFEATRYFSGALTDSGGGGGGGRGGREYASAYEEDEIRAPPRRAQRNGGSDERRLGGRSGGGASAAAVQMKAAEILKKKLHKQPSSPGAKLVRYINSLFYQAASRRKLKCLNPVRDTPEEDDEEDEDDEAAERSHVLTQRDRRRSIGDSPFGPKSSHFCGSSSFATPHFHPNPVIPGARRPEKDYRLHGINNKRPEDFRERERENKWVLTKNSGDDERLQARRQPDWFLQDHESVPAPLMVSSRGRLKSFNRRRDAEHEDEDDLSDSSSDLFELKIYGQSKLSSNGVMSSDGLPVFATTDIEALKRETAISSKLIN